MANGLPRTLAQKNAKIGEKKTDNRTLRTKMYAFPEKKLDKTDNRTFKTEIYAFPEHFTHRSRRWRRHSEGLITYYN